MDYFASRHKWQKNQLWVQYKGVGKIYLLFLPLSNIFKKIWRYEDCGHLKESYTWVEKPSYQAFESSIFHFFNSIILISGLAWVSLTQRRRVFQSFMGSTFHSRYQWGWYFQQEKQHEYTQCAVVPSEISQQWENVTGKLCTVHQNFMWEIAVFKLEHCFLSLSWGVPFPSVISVINTELLSETLRLLDNPHTRTQPCSW